MYYVHTYVNYVFLFMLQCTVLYFMCMQSQILFELVCKVLSPVSIGCTFTFLSRQWLHMAMENFKEKEGRGNMKVSTRKEGKREVHRRQRMYIRVIILTITRRGA